MGRCLLAFAIALSSSLFGSLAPSTIAPASVPSRGPVVARSAGILAGHPLVAGRDIQFKRSSAAYPPTPPSIRSANPVLQFAVPPVLARAAYLIDMQTGRVLYSKHASERLPMASTTKITTAVVALQHSRLSGLAWVSKRSATIGESTMVLARGEQLTVRDLLYGLLLNSANDAAITLAEHVSGKEERFVELMNALARRLHMTHTHYVTSHGLDAPGHYTSAHDLAVIARYAMRYSMFRRIVASTSYYVPKTKHNADHWLANINRAMYWFPGVDGVKPGDTDNAGLCQVISVWRNGKHLLLVLLNTPNLVTDFRNLTNYGAGDFRWVQAPADWDAPFNAVSSAHGSLWTYFPGAGHYIRGAFLSYFNSHGGLTTLGYPRTDQIVERGQVVQYFQGGKLILDANTRSVYPDDIGTRLAKALVPHALRHIRHPGHTFGGLYKRLGGAGVFGYPLTNKTWYHGTLMQFFQYCVLARVQNVPTVVPVGDVALRMARDLPVRGAPDAFPSTMSASAVATIAR